ncbi:hypothetical protein ANO14919_038910 [Xylariales sp. No.14919]|nr:hypothetical protein ANO14919_038910 [Xylariales sp. No.14919]
MASSIDPDEDDPYLIHLASKNKYESWMKCLKDRYWSDDGVKIHILDIMPSGEFSHWDPEVDPFNLSSELTSKTLTHGTRLIIFPANNRLYLQRHAGVLYDVDPGFFRSVALNCDRNGYYQGVEHRVPEFLAGGRPQYLDLGYGWAGVIFRHSDNCNVVLVSGATSPGAASESDHARGNVYLDSARLSELYFQALLKRDGNFFVEVHKEPLVLLLPVLDIHATYLYEALIHSDWLFRVGRINRQSNPGLVEKSWSALRMMRHDGMGPLACIRKYNKDHNGGRIQNSEEYVHLVERFECIEAQIVHTEALARDYLQHHVGLYSLDESRSSIKQAKISINQAKIALEESKRTKLVTVLAIFFVPISLSTSVFGMNIRELNENGQPIWVFLVTTIIIVAVTMVSWGFMYQTQKYHSLPKDDSRREKKTPWTRLCRLLQLISHGHIIWAWKSGILFSLLTDGRVVFVRSCLGHGYDSRPRMNRHHHPHQPCAYIKNHLGFNGVGFKCSKLEDQPGGPDEGRRTYT